MKSPVTVLAEKLSGIPGAKFRTYPGTFFVALLASLVTSSVAVRYFPNSVVYNPSTTLTHIGRGNTVLVVVLWVLSAVCFYSFGPVGSVISAGVFCNMMQNPVADYIHVGQYTFNMADAMIVGGIVTALLIAVKSSLPHRSEES